MGSDFAMIRKILLMLIVIPLVIGGIFVVSVIMWAEGLSDDYNVRRYSVLVEADHAALVEAGRAMIENKNRYGFDSDQVQNQFHLLVDIELNDPNMPDIIRRLNPAYVRLCEDHVYVCVGCGFEHIAVAIYAEGIDSNTGCKLAEGLWYYDDFFDGNPSDLKKFIEELKHSMEK